MNSIQQLLSKLSQYHPLPEALMDKLYQYIEAASFAKDELIFKKGYPVARIYFLVSGLVRWFRTDEKFEVTTWVTRQQQFIYMPQAFVKKLPSSENLVAESYCELLYISYDHAALLYNEFQEIQLIESRLIHELQQQIVDLIYYSRHPDKLLRIQYLARMLPEVLTLSRDKTASLLGMSSTTFYRKKEMFLQIIQNKGFNEADIILGVELN